MIEELIKRAIYFYRTGEVAYGGTSFMGFTQHAERKDDTGLAEINAAIERADHLCVADVLEYKILPLYR